MFNVKQKTTTEKKITSLGSEPKITADGGVIMLSELGLAEGSFVPLSGRPP